MSRPVSIPEQLLASGFFRDEALAAGMAPGSLRARRLTRVSYGLYVAAAEPDLPTRCRALGRLLPPGAVFGYDTARALLGLPTPRNDQRTVAAPRVHLCVPPGQPVPHRAGLVAHAHTMPADHTRVWRGLPITSAARTWVDLAQHLNLVELVVVGDAVLAASLSDLTALTSMVEQCPGRRGILLARRALSLVRTGVRSPMETRTRLVLVLGGLPCPEINVDLRDEFGQFLACVDLFYRPARVVLEYEGDHHRDRETFRYDLARRNLLTRHGYRVLHVVDRDVFVQPHRLVDETRLALQARGMSC
ncbi:MAG: DUF559 domain-containing protein [Actinomycetes bacterium]